MLYHWKKLAEGIMLIHDTNSTLPPSEDLPLKGANCLLTRSYIRDYNRNAEEQKDHSEKVVFDDNEEEDGESDSSLEESTSGSSDSDERSSPSE